MGGELTNIARKQILIALSGIEGQLKMFYKINNKITIIIYVINNDDNNKNNNNNRVVVILRLPTHSLGQHRFKIVLRYS